MNLIQNFILKFSPAAAIVFLSYAILAGLLSKLPALPGLGQTCRNLFYHVPMWFTMYLMIIVSLVSSVLYLSKLNLKYDQWAKEAGKVGIFFGGLGLITGVVWSRVTWGELLPDSNPNAWWSWDPKQTTALIAMLVYMAYFVLRSSVEDILQKAKLAAIYNIFAAASIFPLTYIIPRALGGLHPGAGGGGPVFNSSDIGNEYRIVFYPAIIGFMALAVWICHLRVRISTLSEAILAKNTTL